MADKLLDLVKRRHPAYGGLLPHWCFLEETYEGGRDWFARHIFRYLKEGDKEFGDRVLRAYRFNHTKQVVDLVDKYLFRQPIARKDKDAPESIKRFWKKATRQGLGIDAFSKRISNATSKFGRVYIVVDSSAKAGTVATRADEKKGDAQIYAYILRPQDMLDMSYDELGRMRWALVHEPVRDDQDPMNSSGGYLDRYRLWTTTNWTLYEVYKKGNTEKVRIVDTGEHSLGVVPIIPADHVATEDHWNSAGLIDDVAYLDRAVANYLSNLDAIIQDQTFSQLAMPAQGVLPGETGYDKLVEMGTKRVFLYNADAGKGPEWLAPDPKQAELILKVVSSSVKEIYTSVGLEAARTADDNGGNSDTQSGASKAYDFERVNSLLTSKADSLQLTERRIAALVALWGGDKATVTDDNELVTYPREFDTRGLYDEFEIGARLSLLAAPDAVRQKQMLLLIKKLFPAASEADIAEMEAAVKDWPPEDPLLSTGGLPGTKQPGAGKNKAGDPVAAASTQKTAKELAA
jgi:hypothetical protein